MNDNELNAYVDKLYTISFNKYADGKSITEIKEELKGVVRDVEREGRHTGRTQILNYIEEDIKNLRG